MKKRDDLHIDLFDEAENKFKQHLTIEGNERIIFSGKFGHGKTTFLKEFFGPDNYQEQYEVISLFPVNYSVASNEDIFKYIKYDIILEMLNKNYKVEEVLIGELETIPSYLHENLYKIFSVIICMIPQVGKDLSEMLDKVTKLVRDFKKYHINAENEANEANKLIEYIEEIQQKEGSIFEDNIVSNIIEKILTRYKREKESILLIDDLDRLDPEHVFRILNVFAAHFDRKNIKSKNKFGFDKIIIVCDIENIRSIFRAKYGVDTDFNGYIDKFYSREIFDYNIGFRIESLARKIIINNAKWEITDTWYEGEDRYFRDKFFRQRFFADILTMLVESRQIDLRNIFKWQNLTIQYKDHTIFKANVSVEEEKFPIIFHLRLLSRIKGSPESLKYAIKNVKGDVHKRICHEYIKELVYLNTCLDHEFKLAKGHFRYVLDDIPIYLKIDENGSYAIEPIDGRGNLAFNQEHLSWIICSSIDFLLALNAL